LARRGPPGVSHLAYLKIGGSVGAGYHMMERYLAQKIIFEASRVLEVRGSSLSASGEGILCRFRCCLASRGGKELFGTGSLRNNLIFVIL
jgi:hypothetical protein